MSTGINFENSMNTNVDIGMTIENEYKWEWEFSSIAYTGGPIINGWAKKITYGLEVVATSTTSGQHSEAQSTEPCCGRFQNIKAK